MAVDVRMLKPFLIACETMSFTRAADELGIAQPRMSLLIKRLEDHLGFPLFERGYRSIKLTAEGERMRIEAGAVQDAIDRLEATVRFAQRDARSRLRLGSPRFLLEIPERVELLNTFCVRHPSVKVQFQHDQTNRLLSALRGGEVDVAFAICPFDDNGLESLPFVSRAPAIAIPREHPLALRDTVDVADVRDCKVAVYPQSIGKAYFEAWFGALERAGAILVEAPEDHGITMLRFAAMRRILSMVHVFPDGGIPQDILDTMVIRRINGASALSLRLKLVRKSEPLPAAGEAFWRIAQDISLAAAA